MRVALVSIAAFSLMAVAGEAQWINYPTPRTACGKPDLSGIWRTTNGRLLQDLGANGVRGQGCFRIQEPLA